LTIKEKDQHANFVFGDATRNDSPVNAIIDVKIKGSVGGEIVVDAGITYLKRPSPPSSLSGRPTFKRVMNAPRPHMGR